MGLNISVHQASAVEGEEDPARGLSSFNALHVALLHLSSADKGQRPTFKLLEITYLVGKIKVISCYFMVLWLSKEMKQENIGSLRLQLSYERIPKVQCIFSIFSMD